MRRCQRGLARRGFGASLVDHDHIAPGAGATLRSRSTSSSPRTTAWHKGFAGRPATDKLLTECGIAIFRVEDRKIVERRAVVDRLGLSQQLA